ncbi:MAG: hypothetical protein J6Y91_03980 [Alphaproteobacteria bacterium]|nr:hypothetical protein [Alphaproteobacteria bacterium]
MMCSGSSTAKIKILIIGPLGAGKSSLAYAINKKYGVPRLNLDEVHRVKNGGYRSVSEQFGILNDFLKNNASWVMEGCQKMLYEKVKPDLVVDMRISRLLAAWRFTVRFWKAKKLAGKEIAPDLPVQAYHYRKITLSKILEWDSTNKELNAEIGAFLKNVKVPILTCKSFKDYQEVFSTIDKFNA